MCTQVSSRERSVGSSAGRSRQRGSGLLGRTCGVGCRRGLTGSLGKTILHSAARLSSTSDMVMWPARRFQAASGRPRLYPGAWASRSGLRPAAPPPGRPGWPRPGQRSSRSPRTAGSWASLLGLERLALSARGARPRGERRSRAHRGAAFWRPRAPPRPSPASQPVAATRFRSRPCGDPSGRQGARSSAAAGYRWPCRGLGAARSYSTWRRWAVADRAPGPSCRG